MIILLSFSSCIREYDDVGEENDEYIQLELFTRFNDYSMPVSRTGAANEDAIRTDLFVIVFAEESGTYKFAEAAQTYHLSGIDRTYVILKRRETACKLLILANTQDYFYINTTEDHEFDKDELATVLNGKTLEQACDLLQTKPLNNPQTDVPFTPDEEIPMSYVYETTEIDYDTNIGTETSLLPLQRVVAKIIVKNEAANFTLSGVNAVINTPRQGYLHNLNLSSSLPTTTNLVNYANSSDIASATNNSTEDNPIYLYESAAGNETYLIIKGIYGGETYYYKMAIVDNTKGAIDLLRNNNYIFTITQVNGKGHDSPAEAINAPAFNDTFAATLTIIDRSTYETVASDEYHLSVSNSLYIGYVNVDNDEELTICTMVTKNEGSGTVYGTIDTYNSDWVELTSPGTFTVSSTLTSQPIKVKLKSSTDNKATIRIRLGNIEKKIGIIRYSPIPKIGTGNEPIRYYHYKYTEGNEADTFYSYEYYLLSGYLEDSNNKSWVQLSPGNPKLPELNGTGDYAARPGVPILGFEDKIMVANGQIQIHVFENTSTNENNNGTIFLTTTVNPGYDPGGGAQSSFRIKLDITQLGTE